MHNRAPQTDTPNCRRRDQCTTHPASIYYLHHGERFQVYSLYPAHYYGSGDPYDDLIIINCCHPDDQVQEVRVVVPVDHASTHLYITREKKRDEAVSVGFQPSDLDHPI